MASVFLGDLDDFINPSQSCVNPMFADAPKSSDETPSDKKGSAKISLNSGVFSGIGMSDQVMEPDLIKSTDGKKATVSLDDCLACSGCVTSAETVLITQQSKDEFLSALKKQEYELYVVSLSPQSRAALATHFNLPALVVHKKLITFFKGLGVHEVLDTTFSGDVALMEVAAEFVDRFQRREQQKQQAAGGVVPKRAWVPPPASYAVDSSTTQYVDGAPRQQQQQHNTEGEMEMEVEGGGGAGGGMSAEEKETYGHMPMLASACPGWVCYAEKTQQAALPYISTAKSPQQVMGSVVKGVMAGARGVARQRVLHTAVMPCYDKKLEASRKDFFDGPTESRDVDSVLTTGEVLQMLEDAQVDLRTLPEADLTPLPPPPPPGAAAAAAAPDISGWVAAARLSSTLTSAGLEAASAAGAGAGEALVGAVESGGGSGGYLEYVFRSAALSLFGVIVSGPLTYTQGRNPDFREVSLEVDGVVVLRFALAYGFRNIQTILMKMKRGKCPYDFVEIMACPSGCVNGGGQIPADAGSSPVDTSAAASASLAASSASTRAKKHVADVEAELHKRFVRPPQASPAVSTLYSAHFGGQPFSEGARRLLHTRYHAVPKLETTNPFGIKW